MPLYRDPGQGTSAIASSPLAFLALPVPGHVRHFFGEDTQVSALHEAPQTATKLLVTAMGLIDTFDPRQRATAIIDDFDDPRRLNWDIIPKPDTAPRTALKIGFPSRCAGGTVGAH